MSSDSYIHGYDPKEQKRLLEQAEFWRQDLILPELPYKGGESLLEIGCGAGAVLKILSEALSGMSFAGIDKEARQIAVAEKVLQGRGIELRLGDALALPWPEASFDHVYMMWFLEHLPDPVAVLREAKRVLKPGGTILANECVYPDFRLKPGNADFDYFWKAFCAVFAKSGHVDAGRRQEAWMTEAGFSGIKLKRMGFDWLADQDFKRRIEYILAFSEPTLPHLDGDQERLKRGVAAFRAAARQPEASFSVDVFRATGFKAN
jgi:ubiquinone/menaquinone biosynthesis C-methylase UbiE